MNNYNNLIKQINDIKYINLIDVLKCKTKELEDEINYLNENNIIVIGLYDYVDKKNNSIYDKLKIQQEKNFNIKYQDLLLKIYSINNSTIIRNEIINLNLSLVPYMINILKLNRYKNMDDLFSEGLLGLIKAVEKYDYEREVSFSTYACISIKNYLINHINEMYNLPKQFTSKFIQEKKMSHEDVYSYDDAINFYESIIDKIYEYDSSSPFWKETKKTRINMAFPLNYDDLDKNYYKDYNMDLDIDYEIFKENLKVFLSKLPIKKELIARLYYNLDNKNVSIKEILEICNIAKKTLYYNIYSLKKYSETDFGQKLYQTIYPEFFHNEEKQIIKRK